nr:hypothetical protein [Trebonia kvetii]
MIEHAQVLVDLDTAVVAGRQFRFGHQLGCFHPACPHEHAASHQRAVGELEAVIGRGSDRGVGPNLDSQVGQDLGGLVDQLG